MPRVDTTEPYRGLGDMISLAWIAEAARGGPAPLSFYAKRDGHYSLLDMLGQDVTDDPTDQGMTVGEAYKRELEDGGARLRLDYLCEALGVEKAFRRPHLRLPQQAIAWARQVKQNHGERLALIFPQTLWQSRAWPSCYWVDLAWRLKEGGISVIVMLQNEDDRFKNTPTYMWGFDLARLAALLSIASLVIGNDSGPAHLAGTAGARTIALCGPTRGACVFGHIPNVLPLASADETPGCSGCHFKAPFRAACDEGCQALYSLKPDIVLAQALALLNRAPSSAAAPPAPPRLRWPLRLPAFGRRARAPSA
ncbi:MAG TPA: glycosyltransferase family 9 protein [Pirellulales bacterium]|nr:glycosyltransferase family 9 protein [Pirellulales bacterium]